MAWKNLEQTTLVDAMLIDHAALKELDDVHELIDWSRVEKILSGIHTSKRGEKAWPPLLMFKALLLQSWYALSDPALEKQLARDLLFRRFIGLSITESVPDHSNEGRYRKRAPTVVGSLPSTWPQAQDDFETCDTRHEHKSQLLFELYWYIKT